MFYDFSLDGLIIYLQLGYPNTRGLQLVIPQIFVDRLIFYSAFATGIFR